LLRLSLTEAVDVGNEPAFELLAIDHALDRLAQLDAEQARIVELRFFLVSPWKRPPTCWADRRERSSANGVWQKRGSTPASPGLALARRRRFKGSHHGSASCARSAPLALDVAYATASSIEPAL
jgi:hypothetical protein